MDKLISREDALKALDEMSYKSPHESATSVVRKKHFGEILEKFIMQQPSAQQWIPCSERLPKRKYETQMRGYYLTTNIYGSVGLTKYEFEVGGLGYAWDSNIRIVAWMPLPEPYKGGEK